MQVHNISDPSHHAVVIWSVKHFLDIKTTTLAASSSQHKTLRIESFMLELWSNSITWRDGLQNICLTMVWAGWASWACGGVGLLVTCTPSHISQHFISAPAGINQIQPQCSDTKFPSYIGSFLCFLLILLSTFLRQTKTEGWRLLRTSGDDICWGASSTFIKALFLIALWKKI